MSQVSKNTYIAIQIKEKGKCYAYAMKVSESDNLVARLNIKGIVTANICRTKKEAERIVNHRNACHKANGRYLFDEVAF